ncbi:hypothetical protein WJX84_000176 [Apatococcus fuscideae]|uniref:PH domain-containing protein n=1 Tax=Apatococcus fuscideae TaxID=2026836 RepID=A0AAW1TCF1_9CHLO
MLNQPSLWSNPELTGYLHKQGRKYKGWSKRFFVLKGGNLFYFRLKSDKVPCGVLPLENARVALETLEAPSALSKPKRPFRRFLLAIQVGPELTKKVKRPSVLLAPETSEEQGAWALMLWQATLPHAELLSELQAAGRLQALLETHAAGSTAPEQAKMAQGVARKSMILMAQKRAPSQPPSSFQQDAAAADERPAPPTFAVQASAADVRTSLLAGLMPPERKSLLDPEPLDAAERRSFVADLNTTRPSHFLGGASTAQQPRNSLRPEEAKSAMSHPLWDGLDSPVQAGRMSTTPTALRPSGFAPIQDAPAGTDPRLTAPRRTGSIAQTADPTLSGLRARYSSHHANAGQPLDEMPEGVPIDAERLHRPSVAAMQWGGVAGGLPGRPSTAGLQHAHDSTPRNTMNPVRGSTMGTPSQQVQQRGSYMGGAAPMQQSRSSVAAFGSPQQRMSTYVGSPQSSPRAQRGTREMADSYPPDGYLLVEDGPASGNYAGIAPDAGSYQSNMQPAGVMHDQSQLGRMQSGAQRQSRLPRQQQQEDPAEWVMGPPSRPSMSMQQSSRSGAQPEHTLSRLRSQPAGGLLEPEGDEGGDGVGAMPQMEQQQRQAFRRSSLLATAARQSGFGAILRRASRSMASTPANVGSTCPSEGHLRILRGEGSAA